MASGAPGLGDKAFIGSDLFRKREREFLGMKLISRTVDFSLQDNFQIHVRTLWQPEAENLHPADTGPDNGYIKVLAGRRGRFVTLLHSFHEPLTNSWSWVKFVRPLFRRGFSVVLIDLPGFGRSTVAQMALCDPGRWKAWDSHVIAKVMEALRISKTHIIACHESCGIVFRMMQRVPHMLEDGHLFYNPILDKADVVPVHGKLYPFNQNGGLTQTRLGHFKNGTDKESVHVESSTPGVKIEASIKTNFFQLIVCSGAKIWANFDRNLYGDPSRSDLVKRTEGTYTAFLAASKDSILFKQATVTDISREDVVETAAGTSLLFPSKYFAASVAEFLSSNGNRPEEQQFIPFNTCKALRQYASTMEHGHDGDSNASQEAYEVQEHFFISPPKPRSSLAMRRSKSAVVQEPKDFSYGVRVNMHRTMERSAQEFESTVGAELKCVEMAVAASHVSLADDEDKRRRDAERSSDPAYAFDNQDDAEEFRDVMQERQRRYDSYAARRQGTRNSADSDSRAGRPARSDAPNNRRGVARLAAAGKRVFQSRGPGDSRPGSADGQNRGWLRKFSMGGHHASSEGSLSTLRDNSRLPSSAPSAKQSSPWAIDWSVGASRDH